MVHSIALKLNVTSKWHRISSESHCHANSGGWTRQRELTAHRLWRLMFLMQLAANPRHVQPSRVCWPDSSSTLYRKKKKTENPIFVRTTGRKCDTEENEAQSIYNDWDSLQSTQEAPGESGFSAEGRLRRVVVPARWQLFFLLIGESLTSPLVRFSCTQTK